MLHILTNQETGKPVAAGRVPTRLIYPDATDEECKAIAHCGPGIGARNLTRATYDDVDSMLIAALALGIPRDEITVS